MLSVHKSYHAFALFSGLLTACGGHLLPPNSYTTIINTSPLVGGSTATLDCSATVDVTGTFANNPLNFVDGYGFYDSGESDLAIFLFATSLQHASAADCGVLTITPALSAAPVLDITSNVAPQIGTFNAQSAYSVTFYDTYQDESALSNTEQVTPYSLTFSTIAGGKLHGSVSGTLPNSGGTFSGTFTVPLMERVNGVVEPSG